MSSQTETQIAFESRTKHANGGAEEVFERVERTATAAAAAAGARVVGASARVRVQIGKDARRVLRSDTARLSSSAKTDEQRQQLAFQTARTFGPKQMMSAQQGD